MRLQRLVLILEDNNQNILHHYLYYYNKDGTIRCTYLDDGFEYDLAGFHDAETLEEVISLERERRVRFLTDPRDIDKHLMVRELMR